MIALGILITWLTLTGASFAGLSALRRAGAREDAYAGLTLSGHLAPVLAGARISILKALLQ
jgi:hypothetical protein